MNEKINDKPIEMPARGRPRKKEAGLDQYGNEYEVQKSLYGRNNFTQFMGNSNSILDYIEGSSESDIRNMYPYRNENDIFKPNYEEEMISPKEVQDGKYKGTEERRSLSNEKMHSSSYLKTFGGHTNSNTIIGSTVVGSAAVGSHSFVDNPSNINNVNINSNSVHSSGVHSMNAPSYGSRAFNDYEPVDRRNSLYNRQDDHPHYNRHDDHPLFNRDDHPNSFFFGNYPPVEQKRVSINTPVQEPSFFSPRQQYYSSFTSENQVPLSQFRTTLKDSPQMFGDPMIGSNPWYNRKKRKTNPLLWQYSKETSQTIMHPSKYSSLDYIQGVDKPYPLSSKRSLGDRESNNSILPLYLSSNKEMTEEYKEVVGNFKQKISELDFTNVTVQQLKIFMREFGLNHTGKKNELIDRLKSTIHKIDNRSSSTPKKQEEPKKNPDQKDTDEYGFYFF